MTTVADVLRVAKDVHDRGDIYRIPYGWRGYVSIQQKPPYPPEHFGRMHVDHCGISVGYVYHLAGLRVPGVPTYRTMQYTPSLYNQRNSSARVGAAAAMNWKPGDGEQDHIVLVVGGDRVDADGFVTGRYIDVWETNTDPSGRSKYTRYSPQYFEGFHYPKGLVTAPAPKPTPPAPKPAFAPPGDDMATIYYVPADAARTMHDKYIYTLGVLRKWDAAGVVKTEGASVVYLESKEAFLSIYREYRAITRTNPLSGKPL